MGKGQLVVSALLLVLLLVVACAPQAAPAPVPQAPAPAPAVAPAPAAPVAKAPVKQAWEQEWENTLAAAKQEGKVSLVLGSFAPTIRFALAQGFKQAYGITVESISAKGNDVSNKIFAERRAGIYSYDITLIGPAQITILKPGGVLDSLEPLLILPELTNPELIKKTWYGGKLSWVDTVGHMVLSSGIRVNYPMAINTNLIKEGELKSYRDLLSAKWKGKMVMPDPTTGGSGANFLAFIDGVLGKDYLAELVQKVEPLVVSDERLARDWLVHGKVALEVYPDQTTLIELMGMGAPVKGLILAEGTYVSAGGAGVISVLNKRLYPNAAKLFTNWFLSKEGQSVLVVPMGVQSLRQDVPADHLLPEVRWKEGMKYFDVQPEEAILAGPALQKKAGELLRPLMTK